MIHCTDGSKCELGCKAENRLCSRVATLGVALAEIERLRGILDRIVIGEPGDVHIYFDRDAMNAAKEYLEGR